LFNWRALGKSELLSKGEEDPRGSRTPQDIIGHDAPVMSRILPDRNEHGAFEGHEKEDVTSKVSILASPILFKAVTATKNPCSLDDFLVVELPIKRRITAL